MGDDFGIRVEGVRELVRAIGAIDADVRKGIGQENKAIGQRVIDAAGPKPTAVGAGAGAVPRASASSTSVRIMAGGSWRADRRQVWGKRPKSRGGVERPYIRQAFEEKLPELEREYLEVLKRAARRVGITVE
jgi:hypothetical protein